MQRAFFHKDRSGCKNPHKRLIANLATLQAQEIGALKIVPMFQAEPWIEELLREYLDTEMVFAARQAALELDFNHIGIGMTEKHVLGFDRIELFLLLLALLDIAM